MANDISISSRVRSGLLALQQISDQMTTTQQRLTTGRKVNSALDNPTNYFTSAGLTDRANDLTSLLDQMGNATQVVQAADKGITSITKLVQTAKGLAASARQLSPTDTAGRASLAAQYDELKKQIDSFAADASFNGVNLIKGDTADDLTIVFSERTSDNSLTIKGVSLDSVGLALSTATPTASDWSDNTKIDADVTKLDDALKSLRSTAAAIGSSGAIVTARQDFAKQMISVLKTGSDNLVLADQNAEAANMLALQTRQQLAQTGMSLANQADQSILRLFQ